MKLNKGISMCLLAVLALLPAGYPVHAASTGAVTAQSGLYEEDAADPFSPYVAPSFSFQQQAPNREPGELAGVWHYYIDPRYSDMERATYQYRFDGETVMMSLGSMNSDNGLFFSGGYTPDGKGVLYAAVKEENRPQEMRVQIQIFDTEFEDTKIFALLPVENATDRFRLAFGDAEGLFLPFTRYE